MMNELKHSFELWARGLALEELEQDLEYRLRKEERDGLWERFRKEREKDTVTAHIRLIDLEDDLHEREGYALFWLGLRLGAEL